MASSDKETSRRTEFSIHTQSVKTDQLPPNDNVPVSESLNKFYSDNHNNIKSPSIYQLSQEISELDDSVSNLKKQLSELEISSTSSMNSLRNQISELSSQFRDFESVVDQQPPYGVQDRPLSKESVVKPPQGFREQ